VAKRNSQDDAPPPGSDPQHPDADLLLWAYRHALFPMADSTTGQIEWFSPNPRAVIPLDGLHVSKTLARLVRHGTFTIRSDTKFEAVMRACAMPRPREPHSWISENLIAAYVELHRRGHAHSVEAWLDDQLVGGLYGVHIGGAFFGESMFSRPDLGGTNSSKVCLVRLVDRLNANEFKLLDTQFINPHMEQFGCVEISATEYLQRLKSALRVNASW